MGQPQVGSVVVIHFPFSNLKSSKFRPALVVARAEFENVILCQITSKSYTSSSAIVLKKTDFSNGQLPLTSYIRPDKIFTADLSIISSVVGHLKSAKLDKVLKKIRALFTRK